MKQTLRNAITLQDLDQMKHEIPSVTSDEAVSVLSYLLYCLKELKNKPDSLQIYLSAIDELFRVHPSMDVNAPSVYGELIQDREQNFTYRKKSYTPLQLAVVHQIDPLIERLLNHPKIDVTVGSPIQMTLKRSPLEKRLYKAHIQQFCIQAKNTPAAGLPELLKQHRDAHLQPGELCKALFVLITKNLLAEHEPKNKIALLQAELRGIPKGSAFESFVGEQFKAKLQDELNIILSAHPTLATATGSPARIAINSEPEVKAAPEEESFASKFMSLFA